MDTTMEDNLLAHQRTFIELVTEVSLQDDKIKPSDSYNKELLCKLVASADNIAIRAGKMPKGIETWEAMQWMMPAVQLWFNLLTKFEGAAEHVSGNLMQDYNDTAALRLASKGKAMINISKDGLKRPGTEGQAWTITNNLLVATENQNISTGTPMSINMVLKAIELAQCHLEQSLMADEGEIEDISSAAVLAAAKKPKAKRARVEDVDEGELSAAQIEELQNEISELQCTLRAATSTDSTTQIG
eukprot:372917-Rhodomonas_salina.2